jgi:hypothetical protein
VTDQPDKPFDIKPPTPSTAAMWRVPFDTDWRPVEVPSIPKNQYSAVISIGGHVLANPERFCPAYKVVAQLNARIQNEEGFQKYWDNLAKDNIVITDRRTGVLSMIEASFSNMEAVTAWFVRTSGHEESVLCHERTEHGWYVEKHRDDLINWTSDGVEVASHEEANGYVYRVDMHPHAVMVYGE